MKKNFAIVLTLILGLSFSATQAQEDMKYLFQSKDGDVPISGFAAVINEFSSFNKDFGFSLGGGAALLIDQRFFIGAYGLGLTTRHERYYASYKDGNLKELYPITRFGHGGFWLGYIHKPKNAVHFGVNTKLGWGAVTLTDKVTKYEDFTRENYNLDNVFVITPEITLGLNLLKWMRADIGLGYRFVTGVDDTYNEESVKLDYYSKDAFNSVTGSVTLAFGWFGK